MKLYPGHTSHSSYKDDIANVGLLDLGVTHSLLTRSDRTLHQALHNPLKLGSGQFHVHVFGSCGIHCQVGEVDVSLQSNNSSTTCPPNKEI